MSALPGAPFQLPYPWMTSPKQRPPYSPPESRPRPSQQSLPTGTTRKGLLDLLQDPDTRAGLLAAGAGLLEAGGPSPYPVGFGQAAGRAVSSFLDGRNTSIERSLHQALLRKQLEPKPLPAEDVVIVADPETGKAKYVRKSEAVGQSPYVKPEAPRAPQSRTIERGSNTVHQEWDETSSAWADISVAPRWQPEKPSERAAPPPGFRWKEDGTQEFIPGGPHDPALKPKDPPKPTEADRKNVVLIQGMNDAEKQISELETKTNPAGKWNAAMGNIPLTGGVFQTDEYRGYQAAAKRWAANYLYLKSGAQAGAGEIETTAAQFFPQPGDGPEVIEQKRTARQQELASAQSVYSAQKGGASGSWGPVVGTVERGYRFKGGDPANKSNWEKQ